MDWYYYQAREAGLLIAEWSLSCLSGWKTNFIEGIGTNEALKPSNAPGSPIISIIFIGVIIACAGGIIIKNIETTTSIEKITPSIYLNVFLLMINAYFIAILPGMFFLTDEVYFPFLISEDSATSIAQFYCIGPAYLLQLVSFVAIFPNVMHSVLAMNRFRSEKSDPDAIMEKHLEESREEIALDKFIAELDAESRERGTKDEATVMHGQFHHQGRRKRYQ